MPLPPADAIARRDELLVRTRRTYQVIVVGAVAAAVGLSTAFAHELPGQHSAAQNAAAAPASGGASRPATHRGAHHHHHHHHPLRPPSQPPSPAPATSPAPPAPVTSGGS